MNIHQIIATLTEATVLIGGVGAIVYVTLAADEAKNSYDTAMTALTSGPPAPALEVTDEFIKNFTAGEIEKALIEKYGQGFSD